MQMIGVHPVEKDVYLIEVSIPENGIDWGKVTQPSAELPPDNWQVAYDEQMLGDQGRWIFFFHFLDLNKPLSTPFGEIALPHPTPLPPHLSHIKYEPPWLILD